MSACPLEHMAVKYLSFDLRLGEHEKLTAGQTVASSARARRKVVETITAFNVPAPKHIHPFFAARL
jgi:hypothetical protein